MILKKYTTRAFLALLLIIFIFAPFHLLAAEDSLPTSGATGNTATKDPIKLIAPFPRSGGETSSITEYLKSLFLFGIALATLLALAQLAFGAVQYTASAGAPSLQESSKERMRSAIVGLLLLIGAITILTTLSRPGARNLQDTLEENITVKNPRSWRTQEELELADDPGYSELYTQTTRETRKAHSDKKGFRWEEQAAAIAEKLREIEDILTVVGSEAQKAGYLAARRDIFRKQAILDSSGDIITKADAVYNAYRKLPPPADWAKITTRDEP